MPHTFLVALSYESPQESDNFSARESNIQRFHFTAQEQYPPKHPFDFEALYFMLSNATQVVMSRADKRKKTDVPHFDDLQKNIDVPLSSICFAVHTPRSQTECFVAWVIVLYKSTTNAVTQSAISKW